MKKLIAFLFIIFVTTESGAQLFEVKFGDKLAEESGRNKGNFVKYVTDLDGGILALYQRTHLQKGKIITINNDNTIVSTYDIVKINKDLTVVNKVDLEKVPVKNASFIDFIKLQNKYYLLYQEFDKQTATLTIYSHEFDTKTLVASAAHKVTAFDVSGDENSKMGLFGSENLFRSKMFNVEMSYARDSLVFCMSYLKKGKSKENKSIQFITLDKNFNKLVARDYDFGIPENKMEMTGFDIDIAGKLYVSYDEYDEKDTKSFKKENGEKVAAYTTHLVILDSRTQKNIILNNDGKFLKKINIGYKANDDVIVFGLYKNSYKGNYIGICQADLKDVLTNKKSLQFKFNDFPQDILDRISQDGFGKKDGDKKGIDLSFYFRNMITVSDGYMHVILEYIERTSNTIFGDILVITYLPDGKINYTCIPKKQVNAFGSDFYIYEYSPVKQYTFSFQCLYFGDKLLFFYNDDEDNIKKSKADKVTPMYYTERSSLMCASLEHDGSFITKQTVYNHRKMNGYVTNATFYEIAPDSYAISCLKLGGSSYGIKFGILTIK